jgi:WD40 repeat protein
LVGLLFANTVFAAVKPEIFVQTGHGFGIHAVAYSPDGKLIATGAADKAIKLRAPPVGASRPRFRIRDHAVPGGHAQGRKLAQGERRALSLNSRAHAD